MKKIISFFLLYIILFFFTGCFAVMEFKKETPEKISAGKSEEKPKNTETLLSSFYQRKSLEYEKKNELQMALYYIQIAGSLNSDNKIIAKRIVALKSTIDDKARRHFKKGVVYYKKNKLKSARKQFLITLRYNPDHKGALDYLKNRLTPKEYIIYKTKNQQIKEIPTMQELSTIIQLLASARIASLKINTKRSGRKRKG